MSVLRRARVAGPCLCVSISDGEALPGQSRLQASQRAYAAFPSPNSPAWNASSRSRLANFTLPGGHTGGASAMKANNSHPIVGTNCASSLSRHPNALRSFIASRKLPGV